MARFWLLESCSAALTLRNPEMTTDSAGVLDVSRCGGGTINSAIRDTTRAYGNKKVDSPLLFVEPQTAGYTKTEKKH